jgi:hypothetical protein
MADLRSIDGGKAKRAARVAEARLLKCVCGCHTFVEARTGILLDKTGKAVHRGTVTRVCASCGKQHN